MEWLSPWLPPSRGQALPVNPCHGFRPDGYVDAVVCCKSADYLVHPVEVLGEAARLPTAGDLAVTYSNRCFPTKAVRGWLALDDTGRGALVAELLRRTASSPSRGSSSVPRRRSLWAVTARSR